MNSKTKIPIDETGIDWNQPLSQSEKDYLIQTKDLSLWDKLGWLEEAQRLTETFQAAYQARKLNQSKS